MTRIFQHSNCIAAFLRRVLDQSLPLRARSEHKGCKMRAPKFGAREFDLWLLHQLRGNSGESERPRQQTTKLPADCQEDDAYRSHETRKVKFCIWHEMHHIGFLLARPTIWARGRGTQLFACD